MDFELKEVPKAEVKIFGEVYQVDKPSLGEARLLQKKLKGAGDDDEAHFEIMLGFYDKLGIPEDVCSKLKLDQLTQLSDFLMAKKK